MLLDCLWLDFPKMFAMLMPSTAPIYCIDRLDMSTYSVKLQAAISLQSIYTSLPFPLFSLIARSFGHVCYPGSKTRNHGAATGNQSAPERTQVNCSHSSALRFVEIAYYKSVCFRIPLSINQQMRTNSNENIYLCLQIRAIT